MLFVVRLNDSFNFPLESIKYIVVIDLTELHCSEDCQLRNLTDASVEEV